MKIINYCIVTADYEAKGDAVELIEFLVNEKIAEGWQPLGGVAITRCTGYWDGDPYDYTRYSQAMVKYEETS